MASFQPAFSLIPRPRPAPPEKERAWYPLLVHARNYLGEDEGGAAYARYMATCQ